jgi:hypothetical protein
MVSIQMMKTICSSETSVIIKVKRRHIPADGNFLLLLCFHWIAFLRSVLPHYWVNTKPEILWRTKLGAIHPQAVTQQSTSFASLPYILLTYREAHKECQPILAPHKVITFKIDVSVHENLNHEYRFRSVPTNSQASDSWDCLTAWLPDCHINVCLSLAPIPFRSQSAGTVRMLYSAPRYSKSGCLPHKYAIRNGTARSRWFSWLLLQHTMPLNASYCYFFCTSRWGSCCFVVFHRLWTCKTYKLDHYLTWRETRKMYPYNQNYLSSGRFSASGILNALILVFRIVDDGKV